MGRKSRASSTLAGRAPGWGVLQCFPVERRTSGIREVESLERALDDASVYWTSKGTLPPLMGSPPYPLSFLMSLASRRWLHRRLPMGRAMSWAGTLLGAIIFPLCPILFIIVQVGANHNDTYINKYTNKLSPILLSLARVGVR